MPKITYPVRPLSDVNVLSVPGDYYEVITCFMPDPVAIVGEGNSKAILALDASASLRSEYGFGGAFGGNPNFVELVARKIGTLLSEVTKTGTTEAIYWAVGHDGSYIEKIGEFTGVEWEQVSIVGPKQQVWGKGTKLLPAIHYCVETTAKASDWTMGVFITDGIIEDEMACFEYCLKIGQEIADHQRKLLKLVLIGVGRQVDKQQLERFDNMFEGSQWQVDLWSSGIACSMRDETDILNVLYGELMDEHIVVAPSGEVRDSQGRILKSWEHGLPGKLRFNLPKTENQFMITVGEHSIVQSLSEVLKEEETLIKSKF